MAQTAQITPEVGFFVSRGLLISGQLRAQYVGGLNGKPELGGGTAAPDIFCTPGNGAFAGFAKVTYLLGTRPSTSRSAARSAAATSATRVEFPKDKTCKASATRDLEPDLRRHAGRRAVPDRADGRASSTSSATRSNLIVAVNTALGVPNFTLNFDISVGIGFRI